MSNNYHTGEHTNKKKGSTLGKKITQQFLKNFIVNCTCTNNYNNLKITNIFIIYYIKIARVILQVLHIVKEGQNKGPKITKSKGRGINRYSLFLFYL